MLLCPIKKFKSSVKINIFAATLNYCQFPCVHFYNLNVSFLFSIYTIWSSRKCIWKKIQIKWLTHKQTNCSVLAQDTTHFVTLWLFAKQIMAFGYWYNRIFIWKSLANVNNIKKLLNLYKTQNNFINNQMVERVNCFRES